MSCYAEGCAFELSSCTWLVKGLEHPEGFVLAIPRYVASRPAALKLKEPELSTLAALECSKELLAYADCYGRVAPLVPKELLESAKIFDPLEPAACSEERWRSSAACELLELLRRETGLESVGLTGSWLVQPDRASDIDVVVYGESACKNFYEFLKESEVLEPYEPEELAELLRAEGRIFDEASLQAELRKKLRGKWRGSGVYVRLVPADPRRYKTCSKRVVKLGEAVVEGSVVDDSRSYLHPCSYVLEVSWSSKSLGGSRVLEVVSDRGRFCECASAGEDVLVAGDLELVVEGGRARYQLYPWKRSHFLLPLAGRRRA